MAMHDPPHPGEFIREVFLPHLHMSRRAVALRLGRGRLVVRVRPWAKVAVDGKDVGVTPIPALSLWEGRHSVRLTNPKHGSRTLDVKIKPGKTTRLLRRISD